jgi:hypothetical protein
VPGIQGRLKPTKILSSSWAKTGAQVLDRIGFLGLPVRETSVAKLCGATLLVAEVVLVDIGDRCFSGH